MLLSLDRETYSCARLLRNRVLDFFSFSRERKSELVPSPWTGHICGMDFNALKPHAWYSGAEEEAVTVNMRALIDKVLARYSSEW